jgi:hypothetical protein
VILRKPVLALNLQLTSVVKLVVLLSGPPPPSRPSRRTSFSPPIALPTVSTDQTDYIRLDSTHSKNYHDISVDSFQLEWANVGINDANGYWKLRVVCKKWIARYLHEQRLPPGLASTSVKSDRKNPSAIELQILEVGWASRLRAIIKILLSAAF